MSYSNAADVAAKIQPALEYKDGKVAVKDVNVLRAKVIDELVWGAVFGASDEVKNACKDVILKAAQELKVFPASIYDLYVAIGEGKVKGFSVPAINVRMMNYDFSRAIFRAANKLNAGAILLEIARSESGYTAQPPEEFTTCVLAAAIKENYDMPVFIQGDHFQVNGKNYKADPAKELAGIKDLMTKSINAGFYNIDLDTSTLVDESKPTQDEAQKDNYTVAFKMTEFARQIQPKGVEVSLGGEVGEIGKHNSNVEELTAYMDGYNKLLPAGMKGIAKMAIQTGTSHGGTMTADGKIATVKLDFDTIEKLTKVAREKYKLAGCDQHGASALPGDMFHKFVEKNTLEVHLATEFQNMAMDHKLFPADLKAKMYKWCDENTKDERKPTDSDSQFYYKTRKKSVGPFKKDAWSLPESIKGPIMADLQARCEFLFEQLNIKGTKDAVRKYVKAVKTDLKLGGVTKKAESFDGAD